ncbi:hypothetical protein SAMCCGM7_pC1842 (plasmid) [Sinorhizobium americanum CCGM7]|nr:hypothetical protein SAMCCGM7_pC1842 [Sinorhizobium americanum CCGM7]
MPAFPQVANAPGSRGGCGTVAPPPCGEALGRGLGVARAEGFLSWRGWEALELEGKTIWQFKRAR